MKRYEPSWPDERVVEGSEYTSFDFDVTVTRDLPGLAVRWAGREVVHSGSLTRATSYPFAVLKMTIAGRSRLSSDEGSWPVEPGMIVWMPRRLPWSHEPEGDAKPVNLVVMLAGDEADALLATHLSPKVGCAPLGHPHHIESVFNEIMMEGRMRTEYLEPNCVFLTRVLLARMGEDLASGAKPSGVARSTYTRCRNYIAANYTSIASLAQVAEACNVSVPYLCRLFEQYADTSPYDLLIRLRMQKAEMLLMGGHVPIAKVAESVGYRDQGHFARIFKATHAMSPTEFRRRR